MYNSKIKIIGASIALILLTSPVLVAAFSVEKTSSVEKIIDYSGVDLETFNNRLPGIEQRYDTIFVQKEDVSLAGVQNDLNYNIDTGDEIRRALPIHINEPVEENIPGRSRTASLDPSERDDEDFYSFPACQGQTIDVSVSSSENYNIAVYSNDGFEVATPYTVETTGLQYVSVIADEGAGAAEYTVDVDLSGQNDAGTGNDAGNSFATATSISPGSYFGYMDSTDWEDWYSFNVNSGDGISITLENPKYCDLSDFDIHLYNPSGDWIISGNYYGDDTIEYPADVSGSWKLKVDMFPGWDPSKYPDDYYLYGSGAYLFEIDVGGSVQAPVQPEAQPDITPVAKTYIIEDDPDSNMDEYAYMATIPAANYYEGGERFVSPIIYDGVDHVSTWFTSVDQTTDYLIEDWNNYLSGFGLSAEEINVVNNNPVQAAADIATSKWASSDTAVIAVDGSGFTDNVQTVIEKSSNLNTQTKVTTLQSDDEKLQSELGYSMFLGPKWGAIAVQAFDVTATGSNAVTGLSNIWPEFKGFGGDWWPIPYDNTGTSSGDATDIYHPVTKPGLWTASTTLSDSSFSSFKIIQVPGDRYTVNVPGGDSSLKVSITSDEPNALMVFLVDPDGNIRRPNVPHYNGGEINPIHEWNGGHWEHDQDEFRSWQPEVSKTHTEEVYYPMQGKWTVIVAPGSLEYADQSYSYDIVGELSTHSNKRTNAALSAANAAVIASQENAPLLYVAEDSVPTETQNALTSLGVSNVIFVNIGAVSSADVGSDVEYTTLQEVVDAIKDYPQSENYITITSLGSGEGYYAPSAMMAAYHTSPVLNIGEAKAAYNTLDSMAAWREYSGDYYHGCRSVGHLPQLGEPIDLEYPVKLLELLMYYFNNDQELPPLGLDMKLQWFTAVHDGIRDMIEGYGLDGDGKEAYLFVGSRDKDIRDPICRAFSGNLSYAGLIPVDTPGFSSAVIVRSILYPALIQANPGKDVTTSQMMNYPDGYVWNGNDGNNYPNYATRDVKEAFSAHGLTFEGHCIWDNLLERYNNGALISYYSGHGTGGSGISAQYKNIAEDFPLVEVRHEHMKDVDWWDSWRGYSGYDGLQTKTARWGGSSGYNAQEPNLYDIIHFKWVDQLLDNLHSEMEVWSSCTTGEHWGPIMYLSHGSVIWYGAAGSTYGIQDDLHNGWIFHDMLVEGKGIGESESEYQWIFNRDFTTGDPSTLYGRSTLFQLGSGGLTNVKVIFGDPEFQIYNPTWTAPTPIE